MHSFAGPEVQILFGGPLCKENITFQACVEFLGVTESAL